MRQEGREIKGLSKLPIKVITATYMRVFRKKWMLLALVAAAVSFGTPAHGQSSSGGASGESPGIMGWLTGSADFASAEDIPKAMGNTLTKSVNTSQASAILIGNTLMDYTRDVFFAILGLVIVANFTFIGFRIMLRASVVESLTQFTVSSFILVVVAGLTTTTTPATIIEKAMYQLTVAGRNVGAKIIVNGLMYKDLKDQARVARNLENYTAVSTTVEPNAKIIPENADLSAEPAMYWLDWLGVKFQQNIPTADSVASTPRADEDKNKTPSEMLAKEITQRSLMPVAVEAEYKYSTASLMTRFWGSPEWGRELTGGGGDPDVPEGYMKRGAEAVGDLALGMFTAMAPFRAVNMALTIGAIQTGTVIQPTMQQVGVFSGAILAFYIVTALGVSTLPLIYFNTFRNLWSTYLTVITGIALIPCFYYIFSAIGFVFAANTFESLFPLPIAAAGQAKSEPSFAMVLNAVYLKTCIIALSQVSHVLAAMMQNSIVASVFGKFFYVTMLLGRVTFASGIVASIVMSGVSFALLGGQVAYKWAQGFGAEGLTEKVSEMFSGVQSAIGSGLSSMYSNALNRGSQTVGGLRSGAGGGG